MSIPAIIEAINDGTLDALGDDEVQLIIDAVDLVDLNAIATRINVAYGTLVQWRHRGQFITPDLELSIGPLWTWSRVRTWAIATGRMEP